MSFGEEAEEMIPTEDKKDKKSSSYDFLPEDRKSSPTELPPTTATSEKNEKQNHNLNEPVESIALSPPAMADMKEIKKVKEKEHRQKSESKVKKEEPR